MYCQKCGAQNDDPSVFCQKCGQPLVTQPTPATNPPPPQSAQSAPVKKKRRGCLTAALIVVGIVVVGVIGIGSVIFFASLGASSTPSAPPVSREEYMTSCSELDYDLFARKPDENKGKNIVFSGEIVQTMGESSVDLRVALRKPTDPSPDYDHIVFVSHKMNEGEPRLLEGDIIQVYGVSAGLETYQSVLGGEIKIPKVFGHYIEVLTEPEPGSTVGAIVQQNEGTIGDYEVKIREAVQGKDIDGNKFIALLFDWTNGGNEATQFGAVFEVIAYQNGVELSYSASPQAEGIDFNDAYSNVQPGTSQTVHIAYEPKDTSDITVEVTAMGSDGKVKIVKTVAIQ